MCGYVSLFLKDKKSSPLYKESFLTGLNQIKHRGPDYCGTYEDERVLLGHHRLSIIDLELASSQPMIYLDRYSIVFNGEIFNYKELKNILVSKGYKFKTKSDTEVLIASYDYWQEECVNKFNGMWSFSIYDKKTKTVFASRDRFGVKPFFFTIFEGNIAFASEIKALLPFIHEVYANMKLFAPFISRGALGFNEDTFFKDIYQLKPGYCCKIDLETMKFEKYEYYNLKSIESEDLSEEEVFCLLNDSINLRLQADVKVGACLSGGLDSSAIVALSHKEYDNMNLIHAKSTLKEHDESYYAKKMAQSFGCKLHIIEPSVDDFYNELDTVITSQEEPFNSTSILMQHFVMKKAKELDCKVMLDGQGADEVFLGYSKYFPFLYSLAKEQKTHKDFLESLSQNNVNTEAIINASSSLENYNKMFETIVNKGNMNLEYIDKNIFEQILPFDKNFHISEIYTKSLQALLRYEDRNSMYSSIESRVPFLDYRLVQSMVSKPTFEKVQNGYLKYYLRKILSDRKVLPNDIIWRYNKLGFESPQDQFLDKYRTNIIDEIYSSKIIEKLFTKIDIRSNSFLWKLFCIARWERVFNVKC